MTTHPFSTQVVMAITMHSELLSSLQGDAIYSLFQCLVEEVAAVSDFSALELEFTFTLSTDHCTAIYGHFWGLTPFIIYSSLGYLVSKSVCYLVNGLCSRSLQLFLT